MTTMTAVPDTKEKTKTRLSPRYQVLLHNDDITPIDYVVYAVSEIYGKSAEWVIEKVKEAHKSNTSLLEVCSLEVAEMRVDKCESLNKEHKQKLKMSYEPQSD